MEKIKGFKNTWVLCESGIKKTNLIIEDGIITYIGDKEIEGLVELEDDKIILPGFIDQHIHGANGVDVIDGTEDDIYSMACSLAKEGVTAFLATTTTQSVDVIDKSLETIKSYMDKNHEDGSEVIGVHLEGPFLSDKYKGAQLADYLIKPSVEMFKHFEEKSGGTIKLVTIAVEEEGTDELVEYLNSKNIVSTIGHSAAGYEDMKKAVNNGVRCVTHTYNGMRPLRRDDIGTVGSALLFDELYCELICDGVHSSAPAVKLLWKNKPTDKLILVSDALRTKFMPDGKYYELEQVIVLKGKEARLEDGRLAGSVLSLNDAIVNLMNFTGADFISAVKCVTENPAKNLNLFNEMGSIKENKLANLVIVDKELNVYQTIRKGNVIYKK